jgi:hypothetical protein
MGHPIEPLTTFEQSALLPGKYYLAAMNARRLSTSGARLVRETRSTGFYLRNTGEDYGD